MVRDASEANALSFYESIRERSVLEYVDPLLEALRKRKAGFDADRVHAVATWLVRKAPEREPVKVGIALLGLFGLEEDREMLLTVGRHDEFTLYAAVALSAMGPDGEQALWTLGRNVAGWGRIHIVERLSDTRNAEIRRWLLREGYNNTIMYEYTAFICAQTGGLLEALREQKPDPEVLAGAGHILQALVRADDGGPFDGIEAYDDGAAATDRYLALLEDGVVSLEQLLVTRSIEGFLKDREQPWGQLRKRGWSEELRTACIQRCRGIVERPNWEAHVREALNSDDLQLFWAASQVADALKIDVWEEHFGRLGREDDHGSWFAVCRTDDPERMDRLVAKTEEVIPLAEVATGPAESLGLGVEFKQHRCLDTVVTALARFPGKGWQLVRAGIQCPVVRNRHFALRTLSKWGQDNWATDTERVLRDALAREPRDDVREEIETVLRGEQIKEPEIKTD